MLFDLRSSLLTLGRVQTHKEEGEMSALPSVFYVGMSYRAWLVDAMETKWHRTDFTSSGYRHLFRHLLNEWKPGLAPSLRRGRAVRWWCGAIPRCYQHRKNFRPVRLKIPLVLIRSKYQRKLHLARELFSRFARNRTNLFKSFKSFSYLFDLYRFVRFLPVRALLF